MEPGLAVTLGFVLGIRHAADADHVAAVSSIVSGDRSILRSTFLGVLWGFGHMATLLLAGFLILVLKLEVPAGMAVILEMAVGIALVLLGMSIIKEFWVRKAHVHRHGHGPYTHLHLHSHLDARRGHGHALAMEYRSFAMGLVQGLAGSAALTLLFLTSMASVSHGLLFTLVFGLGSILGMLLLSTAMGLPFSLTANREGLNAKMRFTAGLLSIGVGGSIILSILSISPIF